MLRPWGKGGAGGLQALHRDSLSARGPFQPSDSTSPFPEASTVPWGFLPDSHPLGSDFKSRERVPKVAQQELCGDFEDKSPQLGPQSGAGAVHAGPLRVGAKSCESTQFSAKTVHSCYQFFRDMIQQKVKNDKITKSLMYEA